MPILCAGLPISNYRCAPVAQDLDRDGRKDLVLGEWYSSVRFYRNMGTDSTPLFQSFTNLVQPDPDSFLNGNPPRLNLVDWDGDTDLDMITCDYYGSVFFRRNITGVGAAEQAGRVAGTYRFSVLPNPVTSRVQFHAVLAKPGAVRVDVYAADGRLVATPFAGLAPAGELRFSWDAGAMGQSELPNGAYLAMLRVGPVSESRELLVLH
jgi:hypothetical protein